MDGEVLPALPNPDGGKKKGQHGGRRANQTGRPPGSGVEHYRDVASVRRLMRDGEATPIEVLVHNMRFYWKRAENLTEQIEEAEEIFLELSPKRMMELIVTEPEKADAALKLLGERVQKLEALYGRVSKFRDKAQESAVAAAPYCHPKLAALQVKVDDPNKGDSRQPMLDITPQMTAKEAIDNYLDYLRTKDEQAAAG